MNLIQHLDEANARIAELEAERVQILAKSMDRRRRLAAVLAEAQAAIDMGWAPANSEARDLADHVIDAAIGDAE